MPIADDLLLGKFAISAGFVTRRQVEDCLRDREQGDEKKSLTELLLRRGFLSMDHLDTLLRIQKASLDKTDRVTLRKRKSLLFGNLLVERGWVTLEQLADVLTEQAEGEVGGRGRLLGEILVAKKMVTPAQVRELLASQDKTLTKCVECGTRYNVDGFSAREEVRCVKCKGELAPLTAGRTVGVDASITRDGASASPVGRSVGGCRILEELGRGGMATVYKGRHEVLDKLMAVKVLPPVSAGTAEMIQRFLAEAQAAARLDHPNVVQVYNAGNDGGVNFIQMQFVDGDSLAGILQKRGRLAHEKALVVFKEIAKGLDAAHQMGIVHRDMKPDNVLISRRGRIKVADFGLAQDVLGAEQKEGKIAGTPYYMSPEQWQGKKVDARSDLYALGATFFQMLTGKRPFEAKSVYDLMKLHTEAPPPSARALCDEVPESYDAIARKLLQKAPAKRYADCRALIKDLDRIRQGLDPLALAEGGKGVVCGFCSNICPPNVKRCSVCGETLRSAGSQALLLADEAPCAQCGQDNEVGAIACSRCRTFLCGTCGRRPVVQRKGLCARCDPKRGGSGRRSRIRRPRT